MKVDFFNLKRQYELYKEEINGKILDVLSSGNYIGGENVKLFESEMASYLGVKHVISVASGTDALILALIACNIKEGDEVITTPFTFFATAEAISRVGAVPVFVDVEKDTFNIDSSKIEEKITKKTKAILPVHIFGKSACMNKLNEIAKKHNLYVIEDACQAIGSNYKKSKVGSLGDIGCFSLYPTKNLGVFGDGGFISTNNDKMYEIIMGYKNHGSGKSGKDALMYLSDEKIDVLNMPESEDDKYYNFIIGYNSRLDEVQACIARIKLQYIDKLNDRRREIAKKYIEGINSTNVICPSISVDGDNCFHQFAILVNNKEEFANKLSSLGVGNKNFYPIPLHLQKAFSYLNYKEDDLPVSESICKKTVCLPIYPELTNEEIDYVIECINKLGNE